MTQAPIDENSTNRIASVYLAFAEREAHGRSALYETLARGVAGDSVALSFLAEFPRAKQQPNLLFAAVKYLYQLVAGFSRPVNLSATRDGPRFSGSTTQPGKVQLSGGSEWLETKVGAPFPRNWGWRSLNNLSYRIFPSAAVVRRQSWAFTRSSTTLCYCSIWAASGRSCRSKRMAKVVLKFTTRASIAPGGGGRADGCSDAIFTSSVVQLHRDNLLDITVLHGDGTTTAAKKGGDNIGFSGHKKMKGDKVVAFCDRQCNVIAPLVAAPGNRNESLLLPKALPAVTRIARMVGIDLHGTIVSLDGLYDCRLNRKAIFNRC